MPRFFKLVTERASSYRFKYSWTRTETTNNGPFDGNLSSRKVYAISEPRRGATPWADEMSRVEEAKSRYTPLEDEETGFGKSYGRQTGIRKVTDMRITSQ